ncbi:cytochrome b-c1 complex subunit 8 [Colletes latitarsis]|uniref:cytochrome b-c1 complex subunit 8 n=1 Tax=Colletes latitarsis TaxID=2605962 RepID=UPI004035A51C
MGGAEFGKLPIRIRRIVHYTLSSMEQRFWAKSVSHGIPNLFWRTLRILPEMTPAMIVMIWTYKWSTAEHRKINRKDPRLYENDT